MNIQHIHGVPPLYTNTFLIITNAKHGILIDAAAEPGVYLKALDEAGIGYEKTDVGDKYVAENMRANGHLIGGEQSGHIIFGKYANTGDGLLTAIKLMQVMLDRKKTLSELAAPVREYPQQLTNVEVDDKDATLHDPAVVAAEQAVKHDDTEHENECIDAMSRELDAVIKALSKL